MAIQINDLHKVYRSRRGRQVAVDGLSLEVPDGSVFGFLGPNGSGKTTTIRCLLGLVRPTSGQIALLGSPVPGGLASVRQRVGALVESPKFSPGLTGRRNLQLLARAKGVGLADVDALLARVGLEERARSTFRSYSLGMQQRLAIAATMLGDPQLLILDEPANGLDPAGISEVRELVRSLGAEGRTVFVSSHQLADVERMCDHVAIIDHGSLVTSGSVDDLVRRRGEAQLLVEVAEPGRAASILRAAGWQVAGDAAPAADPASDGVGRLTVTGPGSPDGVTRALADAGLYLSSLRSERRSLEDVYLEITGDHRAPDPAAPSAEHAP